MICKRTVFFLQEPQRKIKADKFIIPFDFAENYAFVIENDAQ